MQNTLIVVIDINRGPGGRQFHYNISGNSGPPEPGAELREIKKAGSGRSDSGNTWRRSGTSSEGSRPVIGRKPVAARSPQIDKGKQPMNDTANSPNKNPHGPPESLRPAFESGWILLCTEVDHLVLSGPSLTITNNLFKDLKAEMEVTAPLESSDKNTIRSST